MIFMIIIMAEVRSQRILIIIIIILAIYSVSNIQYNKISLLIEQGRHVQQL